MISMLILAIIFIYIVAIFSANEQEGYFLRTYYPKYIEKEVYNRTLSVARSYFDDLEKIKTLENKTYELKKQIELLKYRTQAVEKTLELFSEEEQKAIKQNIIKGIPIINCNVNLSERSIITLRKEFIKNLAINLGELI